MPSSIAPMITSSSEDAPSLWPTVLGSPRLLAQRPSPSITRATCLGTSSAGMSGGLAPLGCGSGGRTPASRAPRVRSPIRHAPHDAANGSNAPGATEGTRPRAHCTLSGACARYDRRCPSRRVAKRALGPSSAPQARPRRAGGPRPADGEKQLAQRGLLLHGGEPLGRL